MNQITKTSCNRVLIGSYTHRVKYYCAEDWLKKVRELMQNFPDSEFVLVDNSDDKESPAWLRLKMDEIFGKNQQTMLWINTIGKTSRYKQVESQKVLWDYALDNGYEKLFILESDVFPKDKFAIKKLYDAQKQIVSGVYPLVTNKEDRSKDVLCIMGYGVNGELKRFWYHRFLWDRALKTVGKDKLIKVYACGLGCIMIDRTVLEAIKPEFSQENVLKELRVVLKAARAMKTKSNLKKYLVTKIKGLVKSTGICVVSKIHPDSNFHQACELFGITRHILPEIECEHRRQEWKEIEKVVPR